MTHRHSRAALLGTTIAAWLAIQPAVARAQGDATPKGTLKTDQASSGKTDVAKEGFETAAKREEEKKEKNDLEAKVSAGALGSAGNSRSLAVTAAANVRGRDQSEQVAASIAGNYAQAGKKGEGTTESTQNLQGRVRYDHFFVGSFAGFLGLSARHDKFQGLDLRLNVDPGVAYYFIDEKKQQLWGELGYDFQYDIRRDETVRAANASGNPTNRTDTQHGARAFVGYTNNISDAVSFKTDLEYIQSLEESDRFRINWDAGLTSSIGGAFSVATTAIVLYDNAPLAGVEKTDVTMSVSLVYKLF